MDGWQGLLAERKRQRSPPGISRLQNLITTQPFPDEKRQCGGVDRLSWSWQEKPGLPTGWPVALSGESPYKLAKLHATVCLSRLKAIGRAHSICHNRPWGGIGGVVLLDLDRQIPSFLPELALGSPTHEPVLHTAIWTRTSSHLCTSEAWAAAAQTGEPVQVAPAGSSQNGTGGRCCKVRERQLRHPGDHLSL